jgi:hypothetical protein
MRTFKRILIPTLVLLAVGCEHGRPNLTGPELRLSTSAATTVVPFKGEFVWQAAPATLARCQAGEVAASITKAGQATHLGNFTAVSSHCLNPLTGAITEGKTIYLAANGDELRTDYTGQVSGSEPPLRIDLSVTVTGGTGRFAGASGTISVVSDFNPATGGGAASMLGVMSSPRSE